MSRKLSSKETYNPQEQFVSFGEFTESRRRMSFLAISRRKQNLLHLAATMALPGGKGGLAADNIIPSLSCLDWRLIRRKHFFWQV